MIVQKIRHWAKHTPDATAIEAWGHPISYRLFFQLIQSTRRFLEAQGLQPNMGCALWAGDILDQWVISLAARSLGISVIAMPSGELKTLETVKGVTALLLPQADYARIASQYLPTHIRRIMIPTAIYSAPILEQTDLELPAMPAGDHFCLSSGSTGHSKLIRFKGKEEIELAAMCREGCERDNKKVSVHDFPIYGTVAYKWGISSFHHGKTIVIDQSKNFLENLLKPEEKIGILYPHHIKNIFEQITEPCIRPDLTILWVGGHLPFHYIERLKKMLGMKAVNAIGASELATLLTYTHVNSVEDLIWNKLTRSRKIEIVNDQHKPLPPGIEGRLRVRLERLDIREYEGDAKATSAAFYDGYFYTGDLSVMGTDGRLKLTGRTSDTLSIGGKQMSTAWLEDKLTAQAGKNVYVFSSVGKNNQSELHVIVESQQAPSLSEQEALKAIIPETDAVHFHNLDQFPLNTGGKTDRVTIRKTILGASE